LSAGFLYIIKNMASINTDKINTDKLAERYPEAARELI